MKLAFALVIFWSVIFQRTAADTVGNYQSLSQCIAQGEKLIHDAQLGIDQYRCIPVNVP